MSTITLPCSIQILYTCVYSNSNHVPDCYCRHTHCNVSTGCSHTYIHVTCRVHVAHQCCHTVRHCYRFSNAVELRGFHAFCARPTPPVLNKADTHILATLAALHGSKAQELCKDSARTLMGRYFAASQDPASGQLSTPGRYTEVHSSTVPVHHPSYILRSQLSHQQLSGLPSIHFRNGSNGAVHVF